MGFYRFALYMYGDGFGSGLFWEGLQLTLRKEMETRNSSTTNHRSGVTTYAPQGEGNCVIPNWLYSILIPTCAPQGDTTCPHSKILLLYAPNF